jgi:hypothetical protein
MRRRTSIGMQFRVLRKIALYLLRKTSVPEKRFGTSRKLFSKRSVGGLSSTTTSYMLSCSGQVKWRCPQGSVI